MKSANLDSQIPVLMKKLVSLIFVAVAVTAVAQSTKDEKEIVQSHFGMDKQAIVKEFVKTDGDVGVKFWKLYDAYETERRDISSQKFSLLNKYVNNYTKLSEAETDQIMNEIIQLTATQDKLLATYYKKVKKSCGVIISAQFYQIEWYILSEIRTTILESIPIISELEKRN